MTSLEQLYTKLNIMNEIFGMAEAENETHQYNYDVVHYKLMDLEKLNGKLAKTHAKLCEKWQCGEVGENKVKIASDKIQSNREEIDTLSRTHRYIKLRSKRNQDSIVGIIQQQKNLLHRIKSVKTVLRGIPKKQSTKSTQTIDVLSGYSSTDSEEEIMWNNFTKRK